MRPSRSASSRLKTSPSRVGSKSHTAASSSRSMYPLPSKSQVPNRSDGLISSIAAILGCRPTHSRSKHSILVQKPTFSLIKFIPCRWENFLNYHSTSLEASAVSTGPSCATRLRNQDVGPCQRQPIAERLISDGCNLNQSKHCAQLVVYIRINIYQALRRLFFFPVYNIQSFPPTKMWLPWKTKH